MAESRPSHVYVAVYQLLATILVVVVVVVVGAFLPEGKRRAA